MDLAEIFKWYKTEPKEPLPYSEFAKIGWDEECFFRYLSKIEEIRSAAIIHFWKDYSRTRDYQFRELLDPNKKTIDFKWCEQILSSTLIDLAIFLQPYTKIELYNPLSSKKTAFFQFESILTDSRAVRYTPQLFWHNIHSCYQSDPDPNLPSQSFLYRSFDEIRREIELSIYKITVNESQFGILPNSELTDAELQKINIKSLYKKLDEVETLQWDVEEEKNKCNLDMSTYNKILSWAISKEIVDDIEERRCKKKAEWEECITRKQEMLNKEIAYAPQKILWVHKGNNIICKREKHNIISVCINLLTTTKTQTVSINANYCTNCNQFFISYDEYEHYRKLHPILLGNIHFVSDTGEFKTQSIKSQRAEYSILRLNGYNVSQNNKLSSQQRQAILATLIQNDIISKYEIMDHLDFLINTNGRKISMDQAVQKWEEDLDFVRYYNSENQDKFDVEEIKPYSSR